MSLSNPFSHPSWLNVLFWILFLSFHIEQHTHQHSLLWSEYKILLTDSYAWTLIPNWWHCLESLAGGSRPLEVGFKFYIMASLPGHSFCSLSQKYVKHDQPASCSCLHAFPAGAVFIQDGGLCFSGTVSQDNSLSFLTLLSSGILSKQWEGN